MISLLLLVVEAGKYSKDMNKTPHDISDTPFRMNKVNLLWEKAKKVIASPLTITISDLEVESVTEKVTGWIVSGDVLEAIDDIGLDYGPK